MYKGLTHLLVTSSILGFVILASIIGNVFVLLAIILERNLHNVANYLIASLAIADLMVATLVMPLAAVKEVSTLWSLGAAACDVFNVFDVLCCTASILHLVAISLDRYWAVSRVDYIRNRSAQRILVMIGASWGISTVISVAPLFAWRGQTPTATVTSSDALGNASAGAVVAATNVTGEQDCLISQDWFYTVFSTLGAFYIPLLFMIVVYAHIYQLARARIRKKQFAKKAAAAAGNAQVHQVDKTTASIDDNFETTVVQDDLITAKHCDSSTSAAADEAGSVEDAFDMEDSSLMNATSTKLHVLPRTSPERSTTDSETKTFVLAADIAESPQRTTTTNGKATGPVHWSAASDQRVVRVQREIDDSPSAGAPVAAPAKPVEMMTAREKRERSRERKAARTLAIITGSFIGCWLPFFIVALVRPFCGSHCHFPELLVSIITWLGYLSSLLNPIIYNVFNPDFRSASRKILFGKYRNKWRH